VNTGWSAGLPARPDRHVSARFLAALFVIAQKQHRQGGIVARSGPQLMRIKLWSMVLHKTGASA
jgi:hypothetical protein